MTFSHVVTARVRVCKLAEGFPVSQTLARPSVLGSQGLPPVQTHNDLLPAAGPGAPLAAHTPELRPPFSVPVLSIFLPSQLWSAHPQAQGSDRSPEVPLRRHSPQWPRLPHGPSPSWVEGANLLTPPEHLLRASWVPSPGACTGGPRVCLGVGVI